MKISRNREQGGPAPMHNANLKNVIPLNRMSRPGSAAPMPMSSSATTTSPALIPFQRWQKARDRASAAFLAGETRLLITGQAGTGKTVLLEHVARVLRAAGWTVKVQLADAEPELPKDEGSVALLVDEADRLSDEQLNRLMRETKGPLLLAGLDKLAARAPNVLRISLVALDHDESRNYIAKWLIASGRTTASLDDASQRRVVALACGVPRLLASLLSTAAWLAESSGETVIRVNHVEEAAELRACFAPTDDVEPPAAEMLLIEPAARRRSRLAVPALATVLLLGLGGFTASRLFPEQTTRLLTSVAAVTESHTPAVSSAAPVVVATAMPTVAAPTPAPAEDATVRETAPVPAPEAEPVQQAAPAAPPEPAAVAAEEAPPVIAPVVIETAPPVPAPAPVTPVVVASVRPAHPTLPGATVDLLLRRGREMVGLGDLSAARLLFSRVAETGNTEGMVALGKTYDPATIGALVQPDPAEAGLWYARAAEQGSDEAKMLLTRLKQQDRH